jgi:hypothetical protein
MIRERLVVSVQGDPVNHSPSFSTMTNMRALLRRGIGIASVASLAIMAGGCHGLLEVSDPTLIQDSDVASASGANARRLDASFFFMANMQGVAREVAIFTDEWMMDFPVTTNLATDRQAALDLRNSELIEGATSDDPHLGPLDQIVAKTSLALDAVRQYVPDSLRGDFLGHLYAMRGYAVLQMAEDLCPGFPLNDVAGNQTVYSGPLTTDSALAYASAQLDSALKYVRDSVRFTTLARVAKGRVLLDQGKYTEAATVVAPVPTDAMYAGEPGWALYMDSFYCDGCGSEVYVVGDRDGGTGQSFVTARDPRVPLQVLGVRNADPNDTIYVTTIGMAPTDVTVLASGIEARLIQAEAALQNGQDWKAPLDSLRDRVGLSPLVDPGTMAGRVDVIYSERAFWLYMTGRRLGDLRRLVKNYGRDPETVFPTGAYHGGSGGTFGTATSIPFVFANQQPYNPKLTSGCTSR